MLFRSDGYDLTTILNSVVNSRRNYVLSPVFHHEAKTTARSFVYRLDRIAYKRTTEDFANDRIQSKN